MQRHAVGCNGCFRLAHSKIDYLLTKTVARGDQDCPARILRRLADPAQTSVHVPNGRYGALKVSRFGGEISRRKIDDKNSVWRALKRANKAIRDLIALRFRPQLGRSRR